MSKEKTPKISVAGKFDGLLSSLVAAQTTISRSLGPKEGRHPGSKRPRRLAKAERRRQGKVARRARRFNRRSTKRPKGKRKS